MTELDLREALASLKLSRRCAYKKIGDAQGYITTGMVLGQRKDACAVEWDGKVGCIAVLYDELFAMVCDADVTDDAVEVLGKALRMAWCSPELRILSGQDEAFYRELSVRLGISVSASIKDGA